MLQEAHRRPPVAAVTSVQRTISTLILHQTFTLPKLTADLKHLISDIMELMILKQNHHNLDELVS